MSKLIFITILLAFIVVILGAYVRLSNSGLGCPDWPGCYGQMIVSAQGSDADLVKERPLESGKALREMTHRYAAEILGLLILVLALWMRTPLSFFLLGLVIFQAMLGMWTVTLKLHPFVVMAHLLGGFATLSLLWWMYLRSLSSPSPPPWFGKLTTASPAPVRRSPRGEGGRGEGAKIALVILTLQISLGGWMSANYASVACPDFPKCHGEWFPEMNFHEAFLVWREFGIDYEWGILESVPRVTIHMMHRFGALITFAFLLITALRSMGQSRRAAIFLLAALVVQMSLGIANVVFHLPLAMAVTHNAVAALLLLGLITLLWTFKTFRPSTPA